MTPAQGHICKGGSLDVKVYIPESQTCKLHDEVRAVAVWHTSQFISLSYTVYFYVLPRTNQINRNNQLPNRDMFRVDMVPLTEEHWLQIQVGATLL